MNEDSPQHLSAVQWLDRALAGQQVVGFAWIVLLAFLRLATNQRLFPAPLSLDDAVDVVRGWMARPAAVVVTPTGRHLSLLQELLEPTGTAANLVNDAHLAALALEHGAQVISFDHDFARFPGLRWALPSGP